MLIVATPRRILNPAILDITAPPRKFLDRGMGVLPKGRALWRSLWRLIIEFQFLRYLVALWPFPVALLIWPELALPISQAPLAMFILIYLVESRLLSLPNKKARRALIDEVSAARALDLFAVRGRDILTRIAANRGVQQGEIFLAVEQSELARIAPLTLVSVQMGGREAHVLELSDEEVSAIERDLFADGLSEKLLQTVNLAENTFLRSAALDASTLSAHARLAAALSAQG